MKELTKEQSGWVLARVWIDALEESARDFFGKNPRVFIEKAYESGASAFLRILDSDYGIKAQRGSTLKECIENYIDVGIKGGLFEDKNQFEITEVVPTRLKIKVHKCPYYLSCKDLMDQGVSVSNLTCSRMGCFRGAGKILGNIESTYEVESISKEKGCVAYIENV